MSSTTFSSSSTTTTSSSTATCTTATPGNHGHVPVGSCNSNYQYDIAIAPAVIFALAFALTTLIHFFQAFHFRKWKICWVILMGSLWEFGSFAFRTLGALHQQNKGYAQYNQLLFLLAPMWVNAFDYMVMGRMIYFFVPEKKIWGLWGFNVGKTFVGLDILSFLVQIFGAILISQPHASNSHKLLGLHVYMGGIAIQQVIILIFIGIATRFLVVMRRYSGKLGTAELDGRPQNWRLILATMYISLVLISIRIIFRLAQYSSLSDSNPLLHNEIWELVLDALPMCLAIFLMNVFHPGRTLQGPGSEFPSRSQRKQEKLAVKQGRYEGLHENVPLNNQMNVPPPGYTNVPLNNYRPYGA